MNRFFILLTILLCGCGSGVGGSISAAADTLYAPRYASHFVVLKSGDTTILRVKNPWQGAAGVEIDYTFTEPTTKIITMSSSHGAFLEAIGCGDAVVGVSGAKYLTSPALSALPDVGYDNNMNFELAVALAPNFVTIYEISGENSATTQKLAALGLKTIYIADYLEDSPLAKAEWIVAFGAMCGQIDKSVAVFAAIDSAYSKLKSAVAGIGARPKIMLNSPYRDVWYLPGDSSYVVRLIQDAGGDYVADGEPNNISRAVSVEVAYKLLKQADIWLNPAANINSVAQLKTQNALLNSVDIPVFTNTARTTPSGGSDFWESGTVRPDRILQDLITIFRKDTAALYYYKQIK